MPKMSTPARRALVQERKAQILAAAAKVFAAKGYERATIADIAKQARVAEGSIYNYFKNKGDLLISLPHHVMQSPIESMSALADEKPPEEMLLTMARTMTGTMKENAHIFRILLSAFPNMTKEMREQYLNQVVLYAVGMVEAYFEKQVRRGVFRRNLDPAILALAFVGMFFPTVLIREIFQVETLPPIDYEKIISTSVRVFLQGVLSER